MKSIIGIAAAAVKAPAENDKNRSGSGLISANSLSVDVPCIARYFLVVLGGKPVALPDAGGGIVRSPEDCNADCDADYCQPSRLSHQPGLRLRGRAARGRVRTVAGRRSRRRPGV